MVYEYSLLSEQAKHQKYQNHNFLIVVNIYVTLTITLPVLEV
jgi:hypothetical protein